jgi:hypothetical protein
MGANNLDFNGGIAHGRAGQIGTQGTGFESNNPKFAGAGASTVKDGELGGDQPANYNPNKFAANAGTSLASNGNG